MEPESHQARDPAHQHQEQRIDDKSNETKREDVHEKADDANEVADHGVHDAKDESHQEVGQNHGKRVTGGKRGHRHSRHDERRKPERDGVDDETDQQSRHDTTMPCCESGAQ